MHAIDGQDAKEHSKLAWAAAYLASSAAQASGCIAEGKDRVAEEAPGPLGHSRSELAGALQNGTSLNVLEALS